MSERPLGLSAEEEAFATRLSGLKPAGGGLDRDQLMFLAGQRAAVDRQPTPWGHGLWPMATAASWLVTAAVGVLWMQHVSLSVVPTTVVERDQRVPDPLREPREQPSQPSAASLEESAVPTDSDSTQPVAEAYPASRPKVRRPWRRNQFLMGGATDGNPGLGLGERRVSAFGHFVDSDHLGDFSFGPEPASANDRPPAPPATYAHLRDVYFNPDADSYEGDRL